MVSDTPPSQDAYTHQIWNSYLKDYKRYAPHTIIIKTRSEVKVTVTGKVRGQGHSDRKWYVTLRHLKIHLNTKLRIPISKKIGYPKTVYDTRPFQDAFLKEYRRYAPDSMQFLETRSEVTVTQLWYGTLHHSKMHPHTKFEIPTSKNMRYAPEAVILKTRSEVKVTVT